MSLSSLLSLLLLLTALGYASIGTRIVLGGRETIGGFVGLMFLLVGIWVAGGALELVAPSLDLFLVGRTAHFVGTAFVPVVAFVCFREYLNGHSRLREVVVLMLIPIVSVILAATNPFHELMWQGPGINAEGAFMSRPDRWGPWFLFVHAPYGYAMIGAALFKLLAHVTALPRGQRPGFVRISAACTLPVATTLAYDFGLGPATVPLVPLAFAAMLPIFAWLFVVEGVTRSRPLAFETVFQNMQDPVVVVDGQQRILSLNKTAERMLELDEQQAMNARLESVFGDGSTIVFDTLRTGEPGKLLTASGRFLHVRASPITNAAGTEPEGQVLMFRDVSDIEQAQVGVRNSEKLLRSLIDLSVNGIIRLRWTTGDDRELKCIFANSAAGRFLDVDAESLVDREAGDIVRLAASGMDRNEVDVLLDTFGRSVAGGDSLDVEVCQRSVVTDRWLRMVAEPIGEDLAITLIDVTDGKVRERRMESIALSDPLTGVLNRRGFERAAARRLSESADNATGALLFIDLNGFKDVNDRCGHEVGDQLLTIAGQRLKKTLRGCDIIGRPGGDEFVALVPDVTGEVADQIATRLTKALEETYTIGSQAVLCTASIGLALYPDNASTLTGLLREADQAMYRAKARSRDVPDTQGEGLLEKAI